MHTFKTWMLSEHPTGPVSQQSIHLTSPLLSLSCRAGNQLCVSCFLGLNPEILGIEMHIVSLATSTKE